MNRHHATTRSPVRMLLAALASLAIMGSPALADAYGLTGISGKVGAVDPDGVDGTMMVGGGLEFERMGSSLHIQPNFLYWSNDGLSDLNANFDLYYHFAPAGQVSPYVGAGAGLHFYGSDGPGDPGTDPGANFFGGVLFPAGNARFFMEGRVAATDRTQIGFLSGVTFGLTH